MCALLSSVSFLSGLKGFKNTMSTLNFNARLDDFLVEVFKLFKERDASSYSYSLISILPCSCSTEGVKETKYFFLITNSFDGNKIKNSLMA